jgi:molybdopterin-guanine dinucleotide biosynthesis protein A
MTLSSGRFNFWLNLGENMISHTAHEAFCFHPQELAFCGYSGSGKTTLVEKLCAMLAQNSLKAAYLKHDAHSFAMDHPGKDTARVLKAGASLVVINDHEKSAVVSDAHDPGRYHSLFRDLDLLLVEGYKDLQIPKIIMLDEDLSILERIPVSGDHQQIAYTGPWDKAPLALNRPYFHRDDVNAIFYFIKDELANRSLERPLYGLVMAGGKSRRMGQDKALLQYHAGQNQLEYCYRLLSAFCRQTFVSVRQDQAPSGEYSRFQNLTDSFLDLGPLGGILSAMRAHPQAAFLVLAVDMPAVDECVLAHLMAGRNPFRYATAFQSHTGDFPEPLCTIYEAKAYGRMLEGLSSGLSCPTAFLKKAPIQRLSQPSNSNDLANVNFPHERQDYLKSRGAL